MAKAKHIGGIDCQSAATEGIQTVLVARMSELCSLRDRALNWSDIEGVHDMRVSSRRLRGALNDFAPYLRKRSLSKSLKELKKLADDLGAVRDQDVAILGLQKLAAGAPEQPSITLNNVIRSRESLRKEARAKLRSALNKRELARIERDFTVAVEKAVGKAKSRKQKGKGKQSAIYLDVSRAVVTRRLKELEALSDSFYHPLKIKRLHRMRIAAKHLRYALELFEQCLGPTTATFVKKVAGLQTSLGELHDADVWIEAFGEQLETSGNEDSRDHIAGSLWLLSHFVKSHAKHLRDSLARWEDWETNDLGNKLREILNPPPPEPAPGPEPSEPAPSPEPAEPATSSN